MRSMNEVAATLWDELLALERSLLSPKGRADDGELADMLTDDFLEYGSSGRVWTKPEAIAQLTREEPAPSVEHQLMNAEVRHLSEDVALVTYMLRRRAPQQAEIRTLRSSIWTRTDGRWRMTFHQGTAAATAE
jgi:hypothetical protein